MGGRREKMGAEKRNCTLGPLYKSCDVITFCVNRFWGLFGFSFQVESTIL